MDSKENRAKLMSNPRAQPEPQVSLEQQHSIVCAGSGLNYRTFREDESLASLESTILAGSLSINDQNCKDDEDEAATEDDDHTRSNSNISPIRRRSGSATRAKDALTTVMEVDENNNNPSAVNNNINSNNNQMLTDVDGSMMESSSVLVEDENLLNVNIDAISASEIPSASPMNDDVFFDCSPAKSSPYRSPLDDDIDINININDDGDGVSPSSAASSEKNSDKFELRVYRDRATFGNRLSPIVSCPNIVVETSVKSDKNRSKQQQQRGTASRFVSISQLGPAGPSSSTFSYNTTSGDSGVGDERTGAYIQLIVDDFNRDVTKHAHSTPNEDEPVTGSVSATKQQLLLHQQQQRSPSIVVSDTSLSRKSSKIPTLQMQSMANSSLYRRRVTRLTQHFEDVIKGKGQPAAKKEVVLMPSKLGGPSFVANKSVRSPSYQTREAQKLLRTSKNRTKLSFACSPVKTKHHVGFATTTTTMAATRFNRTRPSSCSDCSQDVSSTSMSANCCTTTTSLGSCSSLQVGGDQSSSCCAARHQRSHSASDASSSIEQSRLQRAIDNKCINVRRRQLTPYYVRPLLNQQRSRLHANSPAGSSANKTISKIVKRKSIGYVSSPIKAQVKPVKELRKMFSPSYNHTLAPKNEGLKKVKNLLEPVPVINISKS